MANQKPNRKPQPEHEIEGITSIGVGGFKSISQEQDIEVRPLTILAGANSSGKSSMMQPLLLLKQTLEAPYDPGALLLNGPNIKFTSVDQLLSRVNNEMDKDTFFATIEVAEPYASLITFFTRGKGKGRGFDVRETVYSSSLGLFRLYRGMPQDEIRAILSKIFRNTPNEKAKGTESHVSLGRNRCFLSLVRDYGGNFSIPISLSLETIVGEYILRIIHLPGLRGNPERNYPVTAVGSEFPGTFERYVASVIWQWQIDSDNNKLEKLNRDLVRLGLAGKVFAKSIDDAQIELLVNRLLHSNKDGMEDMVSIADVGLGVSQALPVVVALHAASEGQLVYLEQPEIHLHPRAQTAMAEVLADAAIQGKRLVVETHSSLLLLGIQTLVAEGKLLPELVKLHWFTQQEDGSTKITSADLDEAGAFGDWPEDFDKVTLDSENRYLDAAEARLRGK